MHLGSGCNTLPAGLSFFQPVPDAPTGTYMEAHMLRSNETTGNGQPLGMSRLYTVRECPRTPVQKYALRRYAPLWCLGAAYPLLGPVCLSYTTALAADSPRCSIHVSLCICHQHFLAGTEALTNSFH